MKRRPKEKLPPIPPGGELLSMVWRDMTTQADAILRRLPPRADETWATADGIRAFFAALLMEHVAKEELARTVAGSTLLGLRRRERQRLGDRSSSCARCIAAALRRNVQNDWPHAAPEQVLLLVAARFRTLAHQAYAEEMSK